MTVLISTPIPRLNVHWAPSDPESRGLALCEHMGAHIAHYLLFVSTDRPSSFTVTVLILPFSSRPCAPSELLLLPGHHYPSHPQDPPTFRSSEVTKKLIKSFCSASAIKIDWRMDKVQNSRWVLLLYSVRHHSSKSVWHF